jgi:P-type Ca2+ transporter type 2C
LFLFPVHIVFLEFVIDPACSVVFEAERSESDSMSRPPRAPAERLFSAKMVWVSLLLGASVLATTCLAYAWAVHSGIDEAQARAFGFAAIVFGNLAMIHATRSRDHGMLAMLRSANPALVWVTIGTCVALLASIYIPPVAELLRFAPLDAHYLAFAALTGIAGVLWYEAYKSLRPRVAPA